MSFIPPIQGPGAVYGPSNIDPKEQAVKDLESAASLIGQYLDGKITLQELHDQGAPYINDLAGLSRQLPSLPAAVQSTISNLDQLWGHMDQATPGRLGEALYQIGYAVATLNPPH